MHEINNVGDFAWHRDPLNRGRLQIIIAFPNPSRGERYNYIAGNVPLAHSINAPDAGVEWNGDLVKPTITSLVQCARYWRGWVRDGMLVEA